MVSLIVFIGITSLHPRWGFVNMIIIIQSILEYPKLGEIWQELKWLFYGGENGFQGNRGNGKLLKRCQARSQREQQWKYWKLSARLKKGNSPEFQGIC